MVACNRFAREKGRWPETLAELVPDLLSEVPRDPYDGAPFRYSAEKGLVWAVGKNLTDELYAVAAQAYFGDLMNYYAPPKTFGFDVSYSF